MSFGPSSSATNGSVVGAARALNSALRGAGIGTGSDSGQSSMDIDGGVGRAARSHRRSSARSSGPLDQSGRHRPSKDTPYSKGSGSGNGKSLSSRIGPMNTSGTAGGSGGGSKGKRRGANINPRRNPQGTPDVLKDDNPKHAQAVRQQHSKMNEILKSDGMRQWLQSRLIAPGTVDMSNLPEDAWLKEQGLFPPGHKDAPPNAGTVWWKLIALHLETPDSRIHTLSLANNGFSSLAQLAKLPLSLAHIRALDLSDNPIIRSDELKHLQSPGEAKGKNSQGAGSLKSLVEIKLNGCKFRDEMLARPNGAQTYQHDVLRRFPGLLILDGVQLNRIVFPLARKPIVRRTEEERKPLAAIPFTYPFDIVNNFSESDGARGAVMAFCEIFFLLFDSNRSELIHIYHPEATLSIAPNTLPSRSFQAVEVQRTSRGRHPRPESFESWVGLPGRNFFRSCTTAEQRAQTLKSPLDREALLKWWNKVPSTKHPIDDPTKWCIDAWYFDDNNDRISAVIQGEFQQLPSGTYRSFTRTFILAAAPPESMAAAKGWPCIVLSDTMVVHSYLGTGSFDSKSSLALPDVAIVPPAAGPRNEATQKAALVAHMRQRTGMNEQFSEMCLAQNEWDIQRAVANFEQIRSSIPPEAFN